MAYPTSKPFNPTSDNLKLALPHLAFEINHFRAFWRLDEKFLSGPSPGDLIIQAVRYGSLLHFRVLLEFFYDEAGKDDIVAHHFRGLQGVDIVFLDSLRKPPTWLYMLRVNLDKLLAHLTESRWADDRPERNYYSGRFAELDEVINRFLYMLPEPHRGLLKSRVDEFERANAPKYRTN